MPAFPVEVSRGYLGRAPETVVDLGCGTGLSTVAWKGNCARVTGVEPNADMLAQARKREGEGVGFVQAFSHRTGLPDASADAVVCSQSFHWMEPFQTLDEVSRLLKPGGVFAAVDCDWPPVCRWEAEAAWRALSGQVEAVEAANPEIAARSHRWEKSKHLENLRRSGHFRYTREIVFANGEPCDARRLCGLALSQGGLQAILKTRPELIRPQLEAFEAEIMRVFGGETFPVRFCYRMRVGVK